MVPPAERPDRAAPPTVRRGPASTPSVPSTPPMRSAEVTEVADPELAGILDLVGRRRRAHRATTARERLGATAPSPTGAPAPATGPNAPTKTGERAAPTGPPGRLLEIERVGDSIGILRIGKPPGLTFTAGQYLRVGLAGVRNAKFTIASAPHDPHLEVCVEGIAGGRLTPRLLGLAPGAVLEVEDRAKGSFVLDPTGTVHLMIATGTGIAPFRSMVRDALHRDLPGSFVVLHGSSWADHLPYADELAALAEGDERLRYVPTVSRPDDPRNRGWTGATGRVDALALAQLSSVAGPSTRVYACGNGAMVRAVTTAMKASGLKVRSETFD